MPKVKISFAYKKGFRRLWMIVSALWILIIAAFWLKEPGGAMVTLQIGILPVVAVYLLGVISVWIIEGFAHTD